MKILESLKELIPLKKDSLKPIYPILEVEDYIKTIDGKYKVVLQVVDPINSSLMDNYEIMDAIQQVRVTLNLTPDTVQHLISSEKQNIDEYLEYLDKQAEKADNQFELDMIMQKKEFIVKNSVQTKNVHYYYIIITSQHKDKIAALEELSDLTKEVLATLEKSEYTLKRLAKDEMRKIIYEKLNPQTSITQPYSSDLNEKSLRSENIKDKENYYEVDGMYYAFYTFTQFPNKVKPSWLKRVLGTRTNLDLSITMVPIDKGDLVDATSNSIREISARKASTPKAKIKQEKDLKSQEKLLEKMMEDSEKLYMGIFSAIIREESLKELKLSMKRLETAIDGSGLRSKKITQKGINYFWYCLPIGYHEKLHLMEYGQPMHSAALASILPFDATTFMYTKGILYGFIDDVSPVIYDRFNTKVFNNPNEAILGMSGAGKSFYVKLQVLRAITLKQVDRIIMIDPEREYFFPNAKRIVFKLGSEFVTNIFNIRSAIVDNDLDGDLGIEDVGEYLRYKIAECVPFFVWIYPEMNNKEKAILTQAIQKAYQKVGLTYESKTLPKKFPTLSTLYDILVEDHQDTMQDLIMSLMPYCNRGRENEGVYACMFDDQTNWDFNNEITVLDIRDLSQEIQAPMMDILTKEIWEEMKLNPKEYNEKYQREMRIGVYVDEAHILANKRNQQTMLFLFNMVKRIRKYYGYIVTATQNVVDYLSNSEHGTAIINNSYIHTYMRMSELDIKELSTFIRFSKKEKRNLEKNKERGRCIHKIGNKRFEMQVKSSLAELKIIDPVQAKKIMNEAS